MTTIAATVAKPPANDTSGDNTYRWLLAWLVMIVVLFFLNKTSVGHVIIYYALVLMIVFVFVTQYKFFANVLGPIGSPAPN